MANDQRPKPGLLSRLQASIRLDLLPEKYPRLAAFLSNDLLWGTVFLVLVVLLLVPLEGLQQQTYSVGDVVQETIIAPDDVRIPDIAATDRKRQERLAELVSIYTFDDTQWRRYAEQIQTIFEEGMSMQEAELARPYQPQIGRTSADLANDPEFIARLKESIAEQANIIVPDSVLQQFVTAEFNEELQRQIIDIVREVLSKPIINMTLYPPLPAGAKLEPLEDVSKADAQFISLTEAREQLRTVVNSAFGQNADAREMAEWLQTLVEPTATLNEAEMQRQRRDANNVDTLYYEIKRGEVIARQGDKISDQDQLAKINYLLEDQVQGVHLLYRSLSLTFFTALFLYSLHRFSLLHKRRRKVNYQIFLLLALTLTINLGLIKIALIIGDNVSQSLLTSPQNYYWVAPFAIGSMLVTLLVGTQIAALYTVVLVFLSGFLLGGNFTILLFALIGGFVGIYGLRQYKERSALIKSGIALGLMNMIVIMALNFMGPKMATAGELVFSLAMGLTGGLLVSIIVAFLLPILESLFRIVTDIRLLELSNHEHPLLRSLFLNAPGTFQHSIVVGYLAEAAAAEINANPLFARVSCLYHDIGKMVKSQYFVENTDDLGRRHEKLSPHMSALVIINHVKEGMELGRKYGLPESIIDIIPQHHGTKLIKYFYEKARGNQRPDDVQVKEEEFRYPGPKPQTREAGIIMIADGVEAAARSLDDPSPGRLKGTIKQIIDTTFLDGQLDECDLTLKDLSKIADAFLRVLLSMKHERIKYPGFQTPEKRPAKGRKSERDGDKKVRSVVEIESQPEQPKPESMPDEFETHLKQKSQPEHVSDDPVSNGDTKAASSLDEREEN